MGLFLFRPPDTMTTDQKQLSTASDPFGKALKDYFNGLHDAALTVHTLGFDDEEWPVEMFFQDSRSMRWYARRALRLARGRILDIGAGAGSYSLLLQKQGFDVEALEISPLAAEVITDRGVKKVTNADFFNFTTDRRYDTLLLLMNGVGIAGRLEGLPRLLARCKELLAPDGQIIMDTTDFAHVYDDLDVPRPTDRYLGEVLYTWEYNGEKSDPFWWVFVDPDTITRAALDAHLRCEIIGSNPKYSEYLLRLTPED